MPLLPVLADDDAVTGRGLPAPFASPPWPSPDYSLGASQVIGHTAPTSGPLNQALWGDGLMTGASGNPVTVYGWLAGGANASSAQHKFSLSTGMGGNYPLAYENQANALGLDQASVTLEKVPDEIQTDHWDWGFRFTSLYGTDYRYTAALGDGASQFLQRHRLYGLDFCLMCYAELYLPQVADGLQLRLGRSLTMPDIESQLAPYSFTHGRSLVLAYDPVSQTGLFAALKLDDHWMVQVGLSAGNDIMAWDVRSQRLTPSACLQWLSPSGDDSLYPCVNGVSDPRYGYNSVQQNTLSWYHKTGTPLHFATEIWYMRESQVPNRNWDELGPPPPAPIDGPWSAFCAPARSSCFSRAYALMNLANYEIDTADSLSLRNGFLNDLNGQRTGIPTWYSEHSLSWTHWLGPLVTVRHEATYARSYSRSAFDASATSASLPAQPGFPNGLALGTQNHLWQLSADVILRF